MTDETLPMDAIEQATPVADPDPAPPPLAQAPIVGWPRGDISSEVVDTSGPITTIGWPSRVAMIA